MDGQASSTSSASTPGGSTSARSPSRGYLDHTDAPHVLGDDLFLYQLFPELQRFDPPGEPDAYSTVLLPLEDDPPLLQVLQVQDPLEPIDLRYQPPTSSPRTPSPAPSPAAPPPGLLHALQNPLLRLQHHSRAPTPPPAARPPPPPAVPRPVPPPAIRLQLQDPQVSNPITSYHTKAPSATAWTHTSTEGRHVVDHYGDVLHQPASPSCSSLDLQEGQHGAQLARIYELLHDLLLHQVAQPVHQVPQPPGTNAIGAPTTQPSSCLLSSIPAPTDYTPVLGKDMTPIPQQHPPGPTAENNLVRQLQQMLTNDFHSNTKPAQGRAIWPRYEGTEWEDPREFLSTTTRLCLKEGIQPEDRVAYCSEQLRGVAAKWYEPYRGLNLTKDEFDRRLLGRFDNDGIRGQLQARLFGERQRGESAALFVSRKQALYRRLMPGIPEEIQVSQVRVLLDPHVRLSLKGANIRTMDDLTELATSIEADLDEIYAPGPAASQQTAKSQSKGPPAIQGAPMIPPSPCKYCQLMHFHRDCPHRPKNNNDGKQKQQLAIEVGPSSNASGNGPRAGRQ